MIELIGIGAVYWLLRHDKDKGATTPQEEDLPPTGGIPTPPKQEWTETSEWSGEYIATGPKGENVVWFFKQGIRYQDGTTEMGKQYIVIGDKNHHNFLRSNSDRGTIDIKWEFTGNPNKKDSKNVQVFATLEDAEKKADALSNPAPRDPTDPVQPQPEPEPEEDKPSGPTLPTRPPMGGGFGGYTPFGGM